jgi:hypothetical protein
MQAQGMAAVEPEAGAQVMPRAQAEQAVSTRPSDPTGNATGKFATEPVMIDPLPVIQAQGIGGAPELAAVTRP